MLILKVLPSKSRNSSKQHYHKEHGANKQKLHFTRYFPWYFMTSLALLSSLYFSNPIFSKTQESNGSNPHNPSTLSQQPPLPSIPQISYKRKVTQIVMSEWNDSVYNIIPIKKTPLVEQYLKRFNGLKTLKDIYALVEDIASFEEPSNPFYVPKEYSKGAVFDVDAALKKRVGNCYVRSSVLITLLGVAGYKTALLGWDVYYQSYTEDKKGVYPYPLVAKHGTVLFEYNGEIYISDSMKSYFAEPPYTMKWRDYLKVAVRLILDDFSNYYVKYIAYTLFADGITPPDSFLLFADPEVVGRFPTLPEKPCFPLSAPQFYLLYMNDRF